MKNTILSIAFLFITSLVFAQKEKEVTLNEETNLFEVTYFHDNGSVSQEGTFDRAGKLHGEWASYDDQGNKVSLGTYTKGVRTGKWFFWTEGEIKEVEFNNNVIASVVRTDRKSRVVIKD